MKGMVEWGHISDSAGTSLSSQRRLSQLDPLLLPDFHLGDLPAAISRPQHIAGLVFIEALMRMPPVFDRAVDAPSALDVEPG